MGLGTQVDLSGTDPTGGGGCLAVRRWVIGDRNTPLWIINDEICFR